MFWTDQNRPARPVMLVACADASLASRCARQFRRLGWEVHFGAADQLDRLAPHVVLADAEHSNEFECSGPKTLLLSGDETLESLVEQIYGQRLAEAI